MTRYLLKGKERDDIHAGMDFTMLRMGQREQVSSSEDVGRRLRSIHTLSGLKKNAESFKGSNISQLGFPDTCCLIRARYARSAWTVLRKERHTISHP
jgi:hypothetical protein